MAGNTIMTAKNYIGYIYMIYNDINKKVYIGETLQSIATKFKQHITKAYDSNRKYDGHLFRAIRKYGKEHFFIKEIDRVIGCDKNQVKKEIQNLEIQYIKKYDSFKNGYNCDSGGGKGAKIPNLETRHKQSLAKLNHPEYIQKAKNNLKKATEQNKRAITMFDFNSGVILENFKYIKEAAIKYNIDDSSICACCKNRHKYLRILGHKVVFRYKEDIYIPKYTVVCSIEDKVLDKFVQIIDGAIKYKVDASAIVRCCKGKCSYAGKYLGKPIIWKYYDK